MENPNKGKAQKEDLDKKKVLPIDKFPWNEVNELCSDGNEIHLQE